MEWSEFAVRFARELAGLDRDTILIVRERDESRHYVQAMRETERLYAEAVSNNFLDGPLALTPADEEVLAEAGWRPPTADWSPANWWTELTLDAPPGAHDGLADMMVTALRDVQGVRRPADLVYESFHRDGYGQIELVDFGIAAADPSRITERRRSAEPVAAPTTPSRRELPAAPESLPTPELPPTPRRPPGTELVPTSGSSPGTELVRAAGASPVPEAAAPAPYRPSEQESRLVDALRTGDAASCYEQFLGAELVLPATGQAVEDPSVAEFTTTMVDGETRVPAFTSPGAMARAMGERAGLHRKTKFPDLAAAWPDPSWSLVINGGLPSEVRVDAVTVARLDEMRRTAAQASTVDALVPHAEPLEPRPITLRTEAAAASDDHRPASSAPSAPDGRTAMSSAPDGRTAMSSAPDGRTAMSSAPVAVRPLPVPHGAQLWRLTDSAPDAIPVAKYDAAADRWIAAESLPQVRS